MSSPNPTSLRPKSASKPIKILQKRRLKTILMFFFFYHFLLFPGSVAFGTGLNAYRWHCSASSLALARCCVHSNQTKDVIGWKFEEGGRREGMRGNRYVSLDKAELNNDFLYLARKTKQRGTMEDGANTSAFQECCNAFDAV